MPGARGRRLPRGGVVQEFSAFFFFDSAVIPIISE
jgi:hypothetical protein